MLVCGDDANDAAHGTLPTRPRLNGETETMNALEIIAELKAGKTITIHANDSMEFIRECERHGETSLEITMSIDWPKCTLSAPEFAAAIRQGTTDAE